MLGPPARMSPVPGGVVMLYEYIDAVEKQFGINLEFVGLDWFKVATGRGTAEQQVLLLLFDDARSQNHFSLPPHPPNTSST